MTKVPVLYGWWKWIVCHSLAGLNIIIFHDGLLNISYCHYNQKEKLENNYKTSFWKSQHFFLKKQMYTNVTTTSLLPLFIFVRFSMTPSTFWMTPKIKFLWKNGVSEKTKTHLPQHYNNCSAPTFLICLFGDHDTIL